jgi:hypothetical protein
MFAAPVVSSKAPSADVALNPVNERILLVDNPTLPKALVPTTLVG